MDVQMGTVFRGTVQVDDAHPSPITSAWYLHAIAVTNNGLCPCCILMDSNLIQGGVEHLPPGMDHKFMSNCTSFFLSNLFFFPYPVFSFITTSSYLLVPVFFHLHHNF